MTPVPMTAPNAHRVEDWQVSNPVREQIPAWEMESIPRLEVDDLLDPTRFHQRLVAWLMNQK